VVCQEISKVLNKFSLEQQFSIRDVVGNYLCGAIYNAIDLIKASCVAHPVYKEIIGLFDGNKREIDFDYLIQMNLERPSPNKIFWKVKRNGHPVLILALTALQIVFQKKKRRTICKAIEAGIKTGRPLRLTFRNIL
jgi:hypothetical protein